jgi:ribosomal protein S17E
MGKFKQGESGNPNGRPKGSVNKTTNTIREAFTKLVEDNLENMTTWLNKVAKDSPKEALDIINKMAEYTTPKLARVENKIETDETINEVKIEIVKRSPTDE